MIKRISGFLFSMPLMGILLVIFVISMAVGTFLERDYGTHAARMVIYNAHWFELIILLFVINLFGNILVNKLYRKTKLTLFVFHLSFIVIILGATITRYIGFEGILHVRELQQTNEIQTSEMFVHIQTESKSGTAYMSKKAGSSPLTKKRFRSSINIDNKNIRVQSVDYIQNANYAIEYSDYGSAILKIVYSDTHGRNEIYLMEGEKQYIDGTPVGFQIPDQHEGIIIFMENNLIKVRSSRPFSVMSMTGDEIQTISMETAINFEQSMLYQFNNLTFVLTEVYERAIKKLIEANDENLPDALVLNLRGDLQQKEIILFGKEGLPGEPVNFTFLDIDFTMAFGPGKIRLPFYIQLDDFKVERYPGSNSPSSYSSLVTIIDKNRKEQSLISMNNILWHQGYRFYQSSYDQDELGSILSVNKDFAGTFVTYIGYILLATGFLLSIFNKNSRLQKLARNSRYLLIFVILFKSPLTSFSQDHHEDNPPVISKNHARLVDHLIVQDYKGRLKPFNTLSSEIIRKMYRKEQVGPLHSNQVFLGMMVHPYYWQQKPLIKVSHPEIQSVLQIKGSHAAFVDFFNLKDGKSEYILSPYVETAFQKKPGSRTKFDNEIIKTDERLNIAYLTFTGDLFKIIPHPGDISHEWYSYTAISDTFYIDDSVRLKTIIPVYFNEIDKAVQTGDWTEADEMAQLLINFQQKTGGEIIPPAKKINMEILYNESEVFIRLSKIYLLLGFVFLIILFIHEIHPKYAFKKLHKMLSYILIFFFAVHTSGLALRWYISGHAPWSNGYESLIYISWATVLAGVIFSRHSYFSIAATSLLASVILNVAHLSWLDPEITNLVPVLKSYWLTIHVSVITASYGFLGLAALLAAINMFFYIFKSVKNKNHLEDSIIRLSGVAEMSIIIGLYLLTIGTFLGGVWANESWGRYWGWDPKETWALITVIVYAFIAHMRFIPGLKSFFTFNFLSLIGYGSVIMTYFGVNYYLAGLHSYAKGDPIPLPGWVFITLILIALVCLAAWFNDFRLKKIRHE